MRRFVYFIFLFLSISVFATESFHDDGFSFPGSRQAISLSAGWNLISFNCEPADWQVEDIFSEEIAQGNLIQLKDEKESYINGLGAQLNTLCQLTVAQGYALKLNEPADLVIEGPLLDPAQTPLHLSSGWNLVAYLPDTASTPESAYASLISAGILEKIQTETQSFDPDLPAVFNTLQQMQPGRGYWVNVNSSIDFYYPSNRYQAGFYRNRTIYPRPWDTVFYPNSTIAYCYVTINGQNADEGDEVGAFIDGECRGVGEVFIMGDHATTFFTIQGSSGETIEFNVWDASRNEVLAVDFTTQTNPGGDIGYPPNQLPIDATGTGVETWQPVIHKHSTTVLGRVTIGQQSAENEDIVAAFVDGQCRGAHFINNCNGVGYLTLAVQGETEENVNFKLWDASEDQIYELTYELTSDPSEILGFPPDYIPLYTQNLVLALDLPDNVVFITDSSLQINLLDYLQWPFIDEIDVSVTGNENLITEINDFLLQVWTEDNWNGSEMLTVTAQTSQGNIVEDFIQITATPTGETENITVEDIAPDQGGWVNISFTASWYDQGDFPESEYYHICAWRNESWLVIDSLAATGAQQYTRPIATMSDSTAFDPALEYFMIQSVFSEGSWQSDTISGYSVDNLAPDVPQGLYFAQGNLFWQPSSALDLAEYQLYKSGEFFLSTPDTQVDMIGISGEFYLVAVDIHGNHSGSSDIIQGGYPWGDVDHDQVISAYDASLVLQYFCLLEPQNLPLPWPDWTQILADVDDNNAIEAFDAALILRFSTGMITQFPLEYIERTK